MRAQGHAHRCHRDRLGQQGRQGCRLGQASPRAPAHGYKAHLAAAKDSGIIRGVETTPAHEADVNIAPSIIPDEPGEVYADRAYDALAVEKAIEARGGTSKLMRKGHRWLAAERREAHNRLPRPIRARIETIFGTWNRSDRFRCMRWIGLSKARLQVHLAVIAYNVKRYGACKQPERTRNADLQNRPSAKPVTTTPSHRSAGDLQSATLLKCLPNHTRRRPTKCHPAHKSRNFLVRFARRKYAGPRTSGGLRPVGMRGKPVLLRDAAEQWIKESKTGDFQHWTGRRLKIRRVRFQAYRLRLVRGA